MTPGPESAQADFACCSSKCPINLGKQTVLALKDLLVKLLGFLKCVL